MLKLVENKIELLNDMQKENYKQAYAQKQNKIKIRRIQVHKI